MDTGPSDYKYDERVSTKVGLMVFEMKRVRGGRGFASGRSALWSYKASFDKAFDDLKREASLEFKAMKKGFK